MGEYQTTLHDIKAACDKVNKDPASVPVASSSTNSSASEPKSSEPAQAVDEIEIKLRQLRKAQITRVATGRPWELLNEERQLGIELRQLFRQRLAGAKPGALVDLERMRALMGIQLEGASNASPATKRAKRASSVSASEQQDTSKSAPPVS